MNRHSTCYAIVVMHLFLLPLVFSSCTNSGDTELIGEWIDIGGFTAVAYYDKTDSLLRVSLAGSQCKYRRKITSASETSAKIDSSLPSAVRIKTVAELGPPPTIAKTPPQIEIAKPDTTSPVPQEKAEDNIAEEYVSKTDEIVGIGVSDTVIAVSQDKDRGNITDEYLPKMDEFVAVEEYPEVTHEATPEYPRLARQAGLEAVVWVNSLVDSKGNVRDVMILKSSNEKAGFNEAAMAAAWKCKYKPAVQNRRPVAAWISRKIEFVLSEK